MKLSKQERFTLEGHVSAINTAHEHLTGAIAEYEAARSAAHAAYEAATYAAFTDLRMAMAPFVEAIENARAFLDDHVSDWQDDYDRHTPTWQNSPAGSAARALVFTWTEWISDHRDPEILLPQEPEVPKLEPIEVPANPADPLSDLPTDAAGLQ